MVSVIIPAFNVEKQIEKCIQSAADQTCKDIEIIVVDDGSSDDTGRICRELEKTCVNLRYIRQENKGVSVARNTGIRESKGDYLMFVDGDDYIEPEITELLLKKAEEGYDIVCCCCRTAGEETVYEDHFFRGDRSYHSDEDKEELFLQLIDPGYGKEGSRTVTAIGVPWGKLYRSSFIRSNGLQFDPELKRLQDNMFNMQAFAAAGSIYYLDLPLYDYRVDHIINYHKGYRHPGNSEKLIAKRKRFFEDNKRLYTEKTETEFKKYICKSFMAGLKYYASGSRTYNRNIRQGFITLTEAEAFSGCMEWDLPHKLKHEKLAEIFIRLKMYLFLFCLLRMTL